MSTDIEEEAAIESPDAETLDEEPRNLLLALMKEIRIGMDLSRITLPTFILEPRSMLEKLTDFMTHGELLALVPKIEDPIERMVGVVRWYMSGFYIRPHGVKKPYNPILGEFHRCKWTMEDGSVTHYVSEQVSHHPPVSALYIANRASGFIINGTLNPRSKFLGTSAASIMEGSVTVYILPLQETYTVTFPSVYARGILFGTLLMEMCGVVKIECPQTGLRSEIEFKAKPLWGGEYNCVSGKIRNTKKATLYTITGKWDGKLDITDNSVKGKTPETLFDTAGAKRIPKVVRPEEEQEENESQRLWHNVTAAIRRKDQKDATAEKSKLEDEQRQGVKDRKETGEIWHPRLFRPKGDSWVYKYLNASPYSPAEGKQEEDGGVIYCTTIGKEATVEMAAYDNQETHSSSSWRDSTGSVSSTEGDSSKSSSSKAR
eukprot:TRINITY_DN1571_c0_g1_i1.p1 TRINITY_DN1571_c0_g1~~TRINITY_DN1571_c0_g1_i1.p1  ORF type:complete len:431 (+),score=100.70 TRINITY_DN1571_c0_g1_i1:292-1584(+)